MLPSDGQALILKEEHWNWKVAWNCELSSVVGIWLFKECTQCVSFNTTTNTLKMGLREVQISEATKICLSKCESFHLIDGGTNAIHSLDSRCCWNWILTLACLVLKQLSSVSESCCEEAPIPRDSQWQEQQDDPSLIECLAYSFNIHFF